MAQSAAGISRERLNRVQAWMDALVGKELLPFASCLVARNGKVEFFKTASSALEAINEDSLFRLYGMSQPLTVAGLFTLWEEGKFGLDEPIKKYIPAFGKMTVFAGGDPRGSYRTVPAKTAITIRMLLTHTSGLSYGYDEAGEIIPVDALYHANNVRSGGQRTTTDVPLERFVNRLARMPLLFEPGTQWHYSLSIDVIGRLIEILSGQNLAAFLKARLFDPLEMTSTAFTMSQQDSRLSAPLLLAYKAVAKQANTHTHTHTHGSSQLDARLESTQHARSRACVFFCFFAGAPNGQCALS